MVAPQLGGAGGGDEQAGRAGRQQARQFERDHRAQAVAEEGERFVQIRLDGRP